MWILRWVRRRGWNELSSTDIYTLPFVKYIASENLLYSIGSSAQGSVMT